MSFVFDIGGKKRAAARYIGLVRRRLVEAVITAERKDGVTRADIARKIGCNRSRITRQLRGTSDITLRSISEIAWALDKRPIFELVDVVPNEVRVNDVRSTWEGEQEKGFVRFKNTADTGVIKQNVSAELWRRATFHPSRNQIPLVQVIDQ